MFPDWNSPPSSSKKENRRPQGAQAPRSQGVSAGGVFRVTLPGFAARKELEPLKCALRGRSGGGGGAGDAGRVNGSWGISLFPGLDS